MTHVIMVLRLRGRLFESASSRALMQQLRALLQHSSTCKIERGLPATGAFLPPILADLPTIQAAA